MKKKRKKKKEKEKEIKINKKILVKKNKNSKSKNFKKSKSIHFNIVDDEISKQAEMIIKQNEKKLTLKKRRTLKTKTVKDNPLKQNNSNIFQRKNKKSTTLIENSKKLHQFFLTEMKVPITQELLVLRQKGAPSDKYIRGKKIGKGTFGYVYESKNIISNNKVAMKIIPKNEYMDDLLIQNEINILKKLSHPNIVRIYEFYETKNCFYLINEFCSGGELFNYINNSKFNEQQLSIIFYQVFSGLKYLHENNIIHRDLKPENILISKIERDLSAEEEYFWIKIIDFGTAKIFKDDKNENSVVGSPYYIAPEVLNKDYNEKCDTWSVGVILYMFLVGRPPFDGSNNLEIIHSIRTKNYDENNIKLIAHSPEVRDLIKHLLEKDTNKRFSAKEALSHIWFKKYDARKLFGNFEEKDFQQYIDNLFNYYYN